MRKIHLKPEQLALLKMGNQIEDPDGFKFYSFPYWIKEIKETDKGENAELYMRAELPGERAFKKGGLEKSKYFIQKSDGSEMDPEAWYFVLRVDKDHHAQLAALAYALSIKFDNPKLSEELIDKIREYNPDLE